MTLEELEARLAALPEDGQLPAATTGAELQAHQARRAALNRRIMAIREAQGLLAGLPTTDNDTRWLAELRGWRQTLVDELFTIKSPCRDKQELGRRTNLQLSLKVIDRGAQHLEDSGYDLTTLRLGELMQASGYQVVGADAKRSYAGALPFFGSIPDTEKRIEAITTRRQRAQSMLDGLLLDDAEIARREAEAKRLRDAANAMNIIIGQDGNLCVVDRERQPVDEETLPELQRAALARAREVWSAGVSS